MTFYYATTVVPTTDWSMPSANTVTTVNLTQYVMTDDPGVILPTVPPDPADGGGPDVKSEPVDQPVEDPAAEPAAGVEP